MFQATEYLQTMRRINKFHDECIQCICEQYGLTKMEATIITFLKNNPGLDTAADMAELRALYQKPHFPGGRKLAPERAACHEHRTGLTAGRCICPCCRQPVPSPNPLTRFRTILATGSFRASANPT